MENKCVCCGNIIPEGRMVCPGCEEDTKNFVPKETNVKTFKLRKDKYFVTIGADMAEEEK